MKKLEEIRAYHDDRTKFPVDLEAHAFINRYFAEYLRVIIECFPYILKTQLRQMFGKSHSVNHERVRTLIERGILGEGIYRGIHYLYPLKKAMVWYFGRSDAIAMNKKPSESYLIDCFTRAEIFIQKNGLLRNQSDFLNDYIMDNPEMVAQLERKISDHQQKQPLPSEQLPEVTALGKYFSDPWITDEEWKNNKLPPFGIGWLPDMPANINTTLKKIQSHMIAKENAAHNAVQLNASNRVKWQIQLEQLQSQLKNCQPKPFPVRINDRSILHLQYLKQDKQQKYYALSEMPNKTQNDCLLILEAAVDQLAQRNCYLATFEPDVENDTSTWNFVMIGYADSTPKRYFKALQFAYYITRCVGKTAMFKFLLTAPSQRDEPVIRKAFNQGVALFKKKETFGEVSPYLHVYDIERYFQGHDTEEFHGIDNERIKEVAELI